jgi:hypothetical protein
MQEGPTGLVSHADIPVTRICGQRDRAVALMERAARLIAEGHKLAHEAKKLGAEASAGSVFTPRNRSDEGAYRDLFRSFDSEQSLECFRQSVDASVWLHLLDVTGMRNMMDAAALKEFYGNLAGDVPQANEDNIHATLQALAGDARLIFLRGLARAFTGLDKRFRSHDAFKIGSRMIFTHVFDQWGSWSYYTEAPAKIADVERVFAVLDGETPQPGELRQAIEASRGRGMSPRQGYVETRYFRVRSWKNGNAHLWFTRDDLVQKANELLAEYYGEALPDAVPKEAPPEKSTALSKDLAFYATPEAVCKTLLRDTWFDGARVLEPSAGTGNIVSAVLARAREQKADCDRRSRPYELPSITAVEVHPGRCAAFRERVPEAQLIRSNFLQLWPRPEFGYVLMNPPFCDTHWMDHVMHAFEFLAPGGILRAVLPVTAELGTSKKHERFRAWVEEQRGKGHQRFHTWEELPAESFAESGTRVSTVILSITRGA